MKKIILSLPFILIILLYSVSTISALHLQEASCDYKEIIRDVVINREKCTIVNARGIDLTGKNWGCPLADDNSKLYTRIKERTQCPAQPAPVVNPPTVPPVVPPPPPPAPPAAPAVLPEIETSVKNYCLNKLGSESQDSCFNSIMNCVTANNLTTCLTADNPPGVALESEAAAPAQLPQADIIRTPTEVWLQTVDGEDRLSMQGGTIRFPIHKIVPEVNEIRVKIVFDKPDKDGSREFYRSFRVRRITHQQVVGTPVDEEACWQMERNECVSCGRSRTVERNTCETSTQFNQFRTEPGTEGQSDELCIASFPTTFFRYECTGCREARRVDQYCDGSTFIAQEGIEGVEECADRCEPLPVAPCEKEDLAYYCEGDENAIYKYRDTECQIQFITQECRKRGQVCRLGDCVNE